MKNILKNILKGAAAAGFVLMAADAVLDIAYLVREATAPDDCEDCDGCPGCRAGMNRPDTESYREYPHDTASVPDDAGDGEGACPDEADADPDRSAYEGMAVNPAGEDGPGACGEADA